MLDNVYEYAKLMGQLIEGAFMPPLTKEETHALNWARGLSPQNMHDIGVESVVQFYSSRCHRSKEVLYFLKLVFKQASKGEYKALAEQWYDTMSDLEGEI